MVFYFAGLTIIFQYLILDLNFRQVITVDNKHLTTSIILIILFGTYLMRYFACDIFHFHDMYLNGIYGKKFSKYAVGVLVEEEEEG